jgi:hypothetical protein
MHRPYLFAAAIAAIGLLVGVASSSVPLTSAFAAVSACALGFAMGVAAARRDRVDAAFPFPAAAVRRELNRARRHGRSVALVQVRHTSETAGLSVADQLQAAVRETDVVWVDGRSTYFFLPDTQSVGARVLSQRLREAVENGDGTAVATAIFPDDGATFGALLSALAPVEEAPQLVDVAGSSPVERRLG